MAYPHVTGEGNLTADPELKWTQNAKAVVNVTVASSKRRRGQDGEWEDEGTTFLRLNVWGDEAERLSEWAFRGCPVLYSGDLVIRQYEGREGEQRQSVEVQFARVSPDPRRLDIQVRKGERRNQDGGGQQGGGGRSWGSSGGGGQRSRQPDNSGNQAGHGWGRTSGGGGQRQQQGGGQDPWASSGGQGGGQQQTMDPWAAPPPSGGGGYDDEPPFAHAFAGSRPVRSRPGRVDPEPWVVV